MRETLQVLIKQHATIDITVPLSMLYTAVGCHENNNIGIYRFNRASLRLEDCVSSSHELFFSSEHGYRVNAYASHG